MSFEHFFHVVHGYAPFPWQQEAARRLIAGEKLSAVSVPTACGKTALIDAAVYAAAYGGARRIAFIIDRRVVVDEAFLRAERIQQKLRNAQDPMLQELAKRLGLLQVVRLRGGVHGDDDWVLYPERVTVLVSTVDQIGSRLLHRGYGVSSRMAPIHAGFVGTRALYLIDEAHLSTSFLATVCAAIDQGADLRVIAMTATPGRADSALSLDLADRCHPVLNQRLSAAKIARLRAAPTTESDFVKVLADAAEELAADAKVIGVVVNRVATARRLWKDLTEKRKRRAVLLTGRVRPYDRERLMREWLPRMRVGRTTQESEPLFVVATQTIEVGADLDFDALVSEAAPLDALRQRFGRLNRLGSKASSQAVIVYRESKKGESGSPPDPIYGMAIHAAWAWLQAVAPEGLVDFGVNALHAVMEKHTPPVVDVPPAPALLPIHVDLLSQTGPDAPQIDVAPWLHGAGRGTADVTLIWRADLVEGDTDRWLEIVHLRPPLAGEALELPIYAARTWLQGGRAQDVTDIEGVAQSDSSKGGEAKKSALRWDGAEGGEIVWPERLRPGDTLVLPATYGGCDEYGWYPDSSKPVEDIADFCSVERGQAHVVRLVPGLMAWLGDQESAVYEAVTELADAETAVDPETGVDIERVQAARSVLRDLIDTCPHDLVACFGGRYAIERHPRPRGVVLRGRILDEVEATLSGGVAVEMQSHVAGVARWAGEMAADHPQRIQIEKAAGRHDLGKSEPRFQSMLYGDPIAAAVGPVLAKSGMRRLTDLRAAYAQSGLPKGFRHELVSLALLEETDPLVRYLVATHHGYGRPWFPSCADENTPGVEHIPLGSGWADLFAMLRQEYGPWKLAEMELLVRAADARQSMAEQEVGHD